VHTLSLGRRSRSRCAVAIDSLQQPATADD
jgi:hypothetical protein